MRNGLPTRLVGLVALLAVLLIANGTPAEAQSVGSITLPAPGGTKALYSGCNNVSLTFPDGTTSETVVQAVTPTGAVESLWRHNAALKKFEGFSPAAPQASDLLTVHFLDAVWLCVRDGGVAPTPEPTGEAAPTATPTVSTPTTTPSSECRLGVPSYYPPAGWMGDIEGIALDPAYTGTVHPPAPTSIRSSYQPGSQGWAGVYFLRTDAKYPQGDWGDEPGYNLSGATRLTFWARGEQGGEGVEFKAGGVDSPGKPYKDTFEKSLGVVTLSQEWQQFSIDLSGLDLSDVIGAFAWVASVADNPGGLTFYLSEITYEGVCELQEAGP